jgi:WD40 repeat protein
MDFEIKCGSSVFLWLLAGEFAAHAGAVNCLKISRRKRGEIATGGDDKKVNIWNPGKSSAILVCAALLPELVQMGNTGTRGV